MISITTGRRLHFGLFTPVPVPELDLAYGGVGTMIDVPGITIQASEHDSWQTKGPHSNRVTALLEHLREHVQPTQPMPPYLFEVTYAAPAHQGWGTGTQLALAVTRLWAHLTETPWSAARAAETAGRGQRSGIGTLGFDEPGLIVDPGKLVSVQNQSRPVPARIAPLPEAWTWLLIEPRGEMGLHSDQERQAFSKLSSPETPRVLRLRTLADALFHMHTNYQYFAETLTEYNRLAGSLFESVQGGDYTSTQTAERIAYLQSLGAKGVGQSSWGPGLFALFPDEASAQAVKSRLELPNCSIYLGKTCRTSPQVDSSPEAR